MSVDPLGDPTASADQFAGSATSDPNTYLGEAARRAIRNPGIATLPRDLK